VDGSTDRDDISVLRGRRDDETTLDAGDAEDLAGSVFRSFAEAGFRPSQVWERLHAILRTNGGSYGLIGPRGAGKSWLMQRAVVEAQDTGGIGLWFPSPSEPKAHDFLSALAANFADEIERAFGRRRTRELLSGTTARLLWTATALLLFFGLAWQNVFDVSAGAPLGYYLPRLLVWAAVAVGATTLVWVVVRVVASLRPRGSVLAEADTLHERIRFSQTLRETGEVGLSAKGALSFKSSRGRELVERPTTTSSLVYDFRALAKHVAEVVAPGRVVVAIDELDKMPDPDAVRTLLRDVKAIFEIPGVHFLVSVSYEAARALKLAGIVDRDEFNSSFYAVLELSPLTSDACADLIATRSALFRDQRRRELDAPRTSTHDRQHLSAEKRAAMEARALVEREEKKRLERWAEAAELRARLEGEPSVTEPVSDDDLVSLAERLGRFEDRQRLLARAVGVLAAGNARETVRLYAMVPNSAFAGSDCEGVERAVRAILETEFEEFRREAFALVMESRDADGDGLTSDSDSHAVSARSPARLTTQRARHRPSRGADENGVAPTLTDGEREGLFLAVRELNSQASLTRTARHLVSDTWDPVWARDLWRSEFQENWRRLLVRLWAGAYLVEHPPEAGDAALQKLREAVERSAESAAVGWLLIRERPFDAPPPSEPASGGV
jgi:KAP family P-loop domain